MEQVLTTSTAPFSSTTKLSFASGPNSTFSYDDIRVIGSSLANTATTFACNAGNELTSQTQNNVTTNFTYDAWGRMATKSRGNYTAAYAWGQGEKLTAVTSNFPGEGNVTYTYGGDGKRRGRNDGSVTKYRWDKGWSALEEENAFGTLTTTLVSNLAQITGTVPSSGVVEYTLSDRLGSLRALYDLDKGLRGGVEYTPFGVDYLRFGDNASRKYTGHDWDEDAELYCAPYRVYCPNQGRWESRDPLGVIDGPNLYGYVRNNPIGLRDSLGLLGDGETDDQHRYCLDGLTNCLQAGGRD
jgi:RHS repeat-associated protein